MERRALGKTGTELSVVGFGGMVLKDESPEDAKAWVAEAIERGVNYFDVGPAYGNAEELMGPALEPYRDDVFLACKTTERTAKGAARDLANSLERLRTGHVDLYQFHSVNTQEDVEAIFAPGGAMETLLEARERGRVRHIGFSSHADHTAIDMLERFKFDSILFPFNITTWTESGLGQRAHAAAVERGIGILALKTLARRPWVKGEKRPWPKCWYCPIDDPAEARTAMEFTLSRPVTGAVSPSHMELFRIQCDAAESTAVGDTAISEAEPIFPAG